MHLNAFYNEASIIGRALDIPSYLGYSPRDMTHHHRTQLSSYHDRLLL